MRYISYMFKWLKNLLSRKKKPESHYILYDPGPVRPLQVRKLDVY